MIEWRCNHFVGAMAGLLRYLVAVPGNFGATAALKSRFGQDGVTGAGRRVRRVSDRRCGAAGPVRRRLALSALGTALALAGATAQAQTPEAADADDVARGVTVQSRPRPEFDPLGVRLPGWRLDGAVETGGGYDDNLPRTAGGQGGGFLSEDLAVAARTDWTRHQIGLAVTQGTRRYPGHADFDWDDYTVGLDGRYDVGRASAIRLGYRHERAHLDLSDFDSQGAGLTRPAPFDIDRFMLGATAAITRLTLDADLEYQALRYEDVATSAGTNRLSLSDHDSLAGTLRAAYELSPGRDLLALTRLEDIRYRDASQRGRDSRTWEVQGGFRYDIDGLWQAQLTMGYRQRDYDQPGLKPLSGLALDGQLVWLPSQLVTLTLGASRTIEESIQQSSVSYTRSLLRAQLDYEMRRNVILTAELRGERRDYPTEDGDVVDGIGLVSARWLLNRNMALIGSYQHSERLSSPGGLREYGLNIVTLRLRFSL